MTSSRGCDPDDRTGLVHDRAMWAPLDWMICRAATKVSVSRTFGEGTNPSVLDHLRPPVRVRG